MKTLAASLAVLSVVTFGLTATANATPITLTATLFGANEVPASGSGGTGHAVVRFDTTLNTMEVQLDFSGLSGLTTASHIHCCLASPFLSGVNVGVATATPTFTGFPLGVKSGTYDHTFDMLLESSYNDSLPTAFFFTHGGTPATAEAALLAGLLADETYINIHTDLFPGGEIRGFLAVQVPEPATLALFGAGLIGLGAIGFLRQRRNDRAA